MDKNKYLLFYLFCKAGARLQQAMILFEYTSRKKDAGSLCCLQAVLRSLIIPLWCLAVSLGEPYTEWYNEFEVASDWCDDRLYMGNSTYPESYKTTFRIRKSLNALFTLFRTAATSRLHGAEVWYNFGMSLVTEHTFSNQDALTEWVANYRLPEAFFPSKTDKTKNNRVRLNQLIDKKSRVSLPRPFQYWNGIESILDELENDVNASPFKSDTFPGTQDELPTQNLITTEGSGYGPGGERASNSLVQSIKTSALGEDSSRSGAREISRALRHGTEEGLLPGEGTTAEEAEPGTSSSSGLIGESFDPWHSIDYRTVYWDRDKTFNFTSIQAKCVEVLWDNAARAGPLGTPDLGQETILEKAGSESNRLSDLFKGNPAFGTMIVPGKTKGAFCLSKPVQAQP